MFSSNSDITAKLVTTDGSNPSVTVILTCDGTQAATLTGLAKTVFSFPPNNPLIYGSCVFSLGDVDNYYTESTVDISILPVLTIAPHSSIAYGQAVTLLVTTNGQSSVQYTASFSCSTGSYQVTGLTTGVTYKLVPAGIYGNTVITVTAANTMPGTLSININKYATNSPPAFIPGRLANYPSVYVNLKDVKDVKIVRPFKNKNLK